MSNNEVAILAVLAERSGDTVSRDELQADALGYSPSTLSRAVDAAISRLRSKLEADPAAPEVLLTIYGVGYRLVLNEPRIVGGDLGAREADRAAVESLLAQHPIVQLSGPPGIGKSWLARRLRQPTRRVELQADEAAARTVLRAFGAAHGEGSWAAVAAGLRGQTVVLDQADERPDALEVARDLAAAGARVLLVRRVPLSLPQHALGGLPGPEALRWMRVARGEGAEPAGLAELVDALGGNPGAIEYFARRSWVVDPQRLLARLREGSGEASVSQPLAERTLEWAWGALDEADRAAVQVLLDVHGPFSIEAAAEILGDPDPPALLDRLAQWVACGVLVRRGERFEVYPLLRLAAARQPRPTPSPGWSSWMRREVAELVALPPSLAVMDRVRDQRGDLMAHLERSLAAGDAEQIEATGWVLVRSGERTDAPVWLLELLDRLVDALPGSVLMRASRGMLLFNAGRRDMGRSDVAAAQAAVRGDEPCLPFVATLAGMLDAVMGGGRISAEAFQRMDEAVAAGTDRWWTARAACTMGTLARVQEHPELAKRALALAAAEWAWLEDSLGEGVAWEEYALACMNQGEADAARAAIDRATALRLQSGTWADQPNAVHRRATVLHDLGQLDDAERLLRHGLDRALATGRPTLPYESQLGWVLTERGDPAAPAMLERCEREWLARGHQLNVAVVLSYRIVGAVLAHDRALALSLAERAPPGGPDAPFLMRVVHGLAAAIYAREGRPADAARAWEAWGASADEPRSAQEVARMLGACVAGRPAPRSSMQGALIRMIGRAFLRG